MTIGKVKCIKNIRGFTKGRVYNLVERIEFDSNDEYWVELYNDNGQEVEIFLPSEGFEVIDG
jgi:hypothetical protein